MPLIQTTMQPGVWVEVSDGEYLYLLGLGLIYTGGDAEDGIATINVKTTIDPDETITVTYPEYYDLLRQGLILEVVGGDPIVHPTFTPGQYLELDDTSAPAAAGSKIVDMVLGSEDLEAAMAAAIAADGTVADAAAVAVASAVAGLDLYTPTVPGVTYDTNGHIASINDGAVTETFVNFEDGRIDYSTREGIIYQRNYVGDEWISTTIFDAPPVPTVTDDFERPSTALGGSTTTTGLKAWSAVGGSTASIDAVGRVYASAGTGNTWATVDCGQADGAAEITLVSHSGVPSTMLAGLVLRYVDSDNLLYVQERASSSVAGWSLIRRLAGATTVLATGAVPANGDLLRVEPVGTNIRVLVNGIEIIEHTVAEFTTATRFGVFVNRTDSVSRLDGFKFYEELS